MFGIRRDRAEGCLLGQLAGDALGSLVEFQSAYQIRKTYPHRVTELVNGGCWDTIAGQPTDDSELALTLARSLIRCGTYDKVDVLDSYKRWHASNPFDCGRTTSLGIQGRPNHRSQANGALMRISPLGLLGGSYTLEQIEQWAREDAALTHPNPVCCDVNALYAQAIAIAMTSPSAPGAVYQLITEWARGMGEEVQRATGDAARARPCDYQSSMGWVLIAWQNALYQLLHAPSLFEGVVDTVMQGGDTDTNAAICGALLGAVYGRDAVPEQWQAAILKCTPERGLPGVKRPRPQEYWPNDFEQVAVSLIGLSSELVRC